jgi:MFS family permease
MRDKATAWLLNVGHAIDHMYLLIFATAVTAIAADFGLPRWESLMPWATPAFFLFGLGALPAGRLGDLWGRRQMMIVFFVGIGVAAILAAFARTPIELGAALTLLGAFAAIYHPVGIPMLVRTSPHPGWTLGINGLAGNLGVALAAVVTGLLVKHLGWRAAFAIPGVVSIAFGIVFALVGRDDALPPARRAPTRPTLPRAWMLRVFVIMTLAATSGSLLFNFSTNGNYELLRERLADITGDPAMLGALLAAVYAAASLSQLVLGRLIDRCALKPLYLAVIAAQIPLLALAAHAGGWWLYALQAGFMVAIFGAIPFTDAMIVRYVDDRMRSRVAGMRLAVSFSASAGAVWLLGPLVHQAGFSALLWLMAGIACCTLFAVSRLPAVTEDATDAR